MVEMARSNRERSLCILWDDLEQVLAWYVSGLALRPRIFTREAISLKLVLHETGVVSTVASSPSLSTSLTKARANTLQDGIYPTVRAVYNSPYRQS
jgi:hypothetical protein